jgi:hypothetical protein
MGSWELDSTELIEEFTLKRLNRPNKILGIESISNATIRGTLKVQ